MSVEKINGIKCVCSCCNGSGISFIDGEYGYICSSCLGEGYVIEQNIIKIKDIFYKVVKVGEEKKLIEISPFYEKKVIAGLSFVKIFSPYDDEDVVPSIIFYEDFKKGIYPTLGGNNGCPVDYMDYIGVGHSENICPNNCSFENCPDKQNTENCWQTINHPFTRKFKRK